ncbi:MAG: prolyl oligopeptidase family serine peptidase [Thermomicrobiales bacterium]
MTRTIAPFGSWRSPITSASIVAGTIGLGDVALDGGDVYWVESRPNEAGRKVIVRRTPDDARADVNPAPFNARTRVHEYGGGAYTAVDGVVYLSNYADQRVYRFEVTGEAIALTPPLPLRYADYEPDRTRGRLICVREDHRESDQHAVNTIVAIGTTGENAESGGDVLVAGNDFYSDPRLSPDGAKLAWLTWSHPNMPWDGTELWVADMAEDGSIRDAVIVAGGPDESIFQPEWSPDGVLHFVSDRSGWWNLHRSHGAASESLAPMEAEFGRPQWVFGQTTYGFASADRIVCTYSQGGRSFLATIDLASNHLETVATPYTDIEGIQVRGDIVAFFAGSPTQGWAVLQHDLGSGDTVPLKASSNETVDPGYLSQPRPIEFPTENGLTAFGFFYPPVNADFSAPEGELPPLVVLSHGGPTGSTSTVLSLSLQYWTSRGFAILDVDYGGSTGYGRAYRERLKDEWGIVDVDDCVNGASFLVAEGLVDGERLTIRGWSASGYTTLAALTFRDAFKAGASHFGISDLEAMAQDTHKFESRYLDGLIGPYPERKDLYLARSPIHFVDDLACPLILFQGLEDKVVPPNQAQMMFDAVDAKGLPVALVMFEGEQHGFRQAKNIRRALDGELYFLSRVFGFDPAEAIDPVDIANA